MALAGGGSRRTKAARKQKTRSAKIDRMFRARIRGEDPDLPHERRKSDSSAMAEVRFLIARAGKAAREKSCKYFNSDLKFGESAAAKIHSPKLRKAAEEALKKVKQRGRSAGC